jgi:hypothetical protein
MNQARSDAKKNLVCLDISSDKFIGELQDACVQLSRLNNFFWEIATELEHKDVDHDILDLRTNLAHFSKQTAPASEKALQTTHVMVVVLSMNLLPRGSTFVGPIVQQRCHPSGLRTIRSCI